MTDVIGSTTNDRTTVTLRPTQDGYVVALRHYAEDRADFATVFGLTPEQNVVVREFFGRIQESP